MSVFSRTLVYFVFRKADFEANDFYVAMTGDTFEWIIQNQSHMIPYILIKGTIFARMSPENKEYFKKLTQQSVLRHITKYVIDQMTS